jgi:DNA repair protein RadA/Sms
MAKAANLFVCQSCGASHRRWVGRCEACGDWNSVVEEAARPIVPKGLSKGKGKGLALEPLQGATSDTARVVTGNHEFDRVCGGGLVPGSAVLIGGDPGIGKSTLLLQCVAILSQHGQNCIYVSGEEATAQIRLRADRLGLADAPMRVAAANSVRDVITAAEADPQPNVLVVDSIQTMFVDNLDSAPGSVAQVRASAHELIRLAKASDCVLLLVGHVTKDGQIAGPRVLEHMVDTVLYFEGERGHQFRILRAVKNRFGPTDEIGVFEMTDAGLKEVENPSALFLGERNEGVSGSAVFAGMEGSRPVLMEIQALVAPSSLGTPRRAVVGWESSRLSMVLAVLEARCGVSFAGKDVYLNIAGGLRVTEPAADLAAAAALISSVCNQPLPPATVVFGEIGLSGEIRPVGQAAARLKEAGKLGFENAFVPGGLKNQAQSIRCATFQQLVDFVAHLAPPA